MARGARRKRGIFTDIMVALAAAIAAALVLPRAVWPYTRMLVTITHEGAHGVAAFVTGRRLQGIRCTPTLRG